MEERPEVDQGEVSPLEPAETPGEDEYRAFLNAVRQAAGWRVSPRQLETALQVIAGAGEEATPERVAEIVSATRGERSQRQRRHADLWRELGALLVVHGQPGDPEAQRAFIGRARAAARRSLGDAFLLRVAIQVAVEGGPVDPEFVGRVARWLSRRGGEHMAEDELAASIPAAIAVVTGRAEAEASPARGRATRRPAAGRGRRDAPTRRGPNRRRRG